MRDKDAVDFERKKLSANLDKAAKAIEKLTESEKSLTTRVVSLLGGHFDRYSPTPLQTDLEKELVLWKKVGEKHRERGTILEGELAEWRARALGEHKNVEEVTVKSVSSHTWANEAGP